jgi:hypothetical protein
MNKVLKEPEFEYVAFAKCGCIVGVCVDMADAFTGKSVAEWIKKGCTVERKNRQEFFAVLDEKGFGCKCQHKNLVEQLVLFKS